MSSRPRVSELVKLGTAYEKAGWRSLGRLLTGRRDVGDGESGFAYKSPVMAPLIVIVLVSVVEIVAFELIVSWPPLRIALLVLGIWGLVFMLGMLASMIVFPHVVGSEDLRIRSGAMFDVRIPLSAVESVRPVMRGIDGKSLRVDGETLNVVMGGQTTVHITLSRPVEVEIPKQGLVLVTAVRLHADDAKAFTKAVKARLQDHAA